MVLFIITFIFYFSWMGNRLFSGTIEGVQSFSTLPDAFFYMVVLLTTSNYPDVMMPSYSDNRMNAIFFITFLIIGLFLLMNLLLAIFYAKYQEKADEGIDNAKISRNEFLCELFLEFDKEGNGFIDKSQTFKYMEEINALVKNQDKKDDEMAMSNMQFEQLFKIID
jgi:heme/copper-type cytochrome/quinol oxidase subunit 2